MEIILWARRYNLADEVEFYINVMRMLSFSKWTLLVQRAMEGLDSMSIFGLLQEQINPTFDHWLISRRRHKDQKPLHFCKGVDTTLH